MVDDVSELELWVGEVELSQKTQPVRRPGTDSPHQDAGWLAKFLYQFSARHIVILCVELPS